MTIIFRYHIPGSVDIDLPDPAQVEDTEALLALPRLQRMAQGETFKRFRQSRYTPEWWIVVAEYSDGQIWVVGYASEKLDLPGERQE